MDFALLTLPARLLEHIDVAWTFLLLVTRFTGLMAFLPGLGMGVSGLVVRLPAILILSLAALSTSPVAPMPTDMALMMVSFLGEFMLGSAIGMIPLLVIGGVQMAGQLASTTMGLQPSQLIDPSFNVSLSDVSRIYSEIVIIIFMMLGGHIVAVQVAAGLGGQLIPGTFVPGDITLDVLIGKAGDIFRLGVVLSGPVIVALLLTNFVMGLISKAVPTINIFIISFPLTIGIGLLLSILVLPELFSVVVREFGTIEPAITTLLEEVSKVAPSAT